MCKKDVIKILVGSLNQAGMKVADYLKIIQPTAWALSPRKPTKSA